MVIISQSRVVWPVQLMVVPIRHEEVMAVVAFCKSRMLDDVVENQGACAYEGRNRIGFEIGPHLALQDDYGGAICHLREEEGVTRRVFLSLKTVRE